MARTKARRKAAAIRMANLHSIDSLSASGLASLFPEAQPLVLELGCGKAESLVAMALSDSGRNYLGVDLKSARLWSAADAARRHGLDHLQLLLAPVARLSDVLGSGTVSEVWIPFPDPVARGSKAHKRLVSPEHLALYGMWMMPGARLHVKSDDPALFAYAQKAVAAASFRLLTVERDLYRSPLALPLECFMSTYERRFLALGKPIHYLCAEKAPVAAHAW